MIDPHDVRSRLGADAEAAAEGWDAPTGATGFCVHFTAGCPNPKTEMHALTGQAKSRRWTVRQNNKGHRAKTCEHTDDDDTTLGAKS